MWYAQRVTVKSNVIYPELTMLFCPNETRWNKLFKKLKIIICFNVDCTSVFPVISLRSSTLISKLFEHKVKNVDGLFYPLAWVEYFCRNILFLLPELQNRPVSMTSLAFSYRSIVPRNTPPCQWYTWLYYILYEKHWIFIYLYLLNFHIQTHLSCRIKGFRNNFDIIPTPARRQIRET